MFGVFKLGADGRYRCRCNTVSTDSAS